MENTRNTITKEELLEEIAVMLRDEFVATVTKEETICLQFLNGQQFEVTIKEI